MLTYVNIMHIIMILLLFNITIFIFKQTPSRQQNDLLLMTIAALIMVVSYAFEVNADSLERAFLAVQIGYLGKPFAALFSFLFVVDRFNYSNIIKKGVRWTLFFASALITTLVFTSRYHGLYYSSVDYVQNEGDLFAHVSLGHGPFYYLYTVLLIIYMLAETVIIIREYRKSTTSFERQQLVYLALVIISAILGFVVFLTGITKGYDTTVIGCFLGGVFLMFLFYKFRIFDAMEVVKEYALNMSDHGIIVLDNADRVVYCNDMMMDIFPNLQKGIATDAITTLRDYATQGRIFAWENSFYESQEFPVIGESGSLYGKSLELKDVTVNYLYSKNLEQAVEERTSEIRDIQQNVVAGFAEIVEARDDATGAHVKRTSTIVRTVAETLRKDSPYKKQLSKKYVDMLEETASLHDVGKISIPDSILLKPGKLTAEEYDIMKTHTTLGGELIEKVFRGVEADEYIDMAKEIAVGHHEKWNGQGYPLGLSGEDIPLSARIMSIADVYDALRSERVYKAGFSKDESVSIIVKDSGEHFDPYVVRAFMENIDTIDSMYE